MLSLPRDLLAIANCEKHLKLLREQLIVVVETVTKQRIRLDEGSTTGHYLCTAAGKQIDRRKILKHSHRIVRAQHRHRARESNPFRPLRSRSKNNRGR